MPDGTTPTPDPTILTTEQLIRAIGNERDLTDAQLDVIRERLDAIDKATVLLNETVTRVPTAMQTEIGHLGQVVDQRFASVDQRFESNDVAIHKEARTTADALATQAELFRSTTDGLQNQVLDLKDRLNRIDGMKAGGQAVYVALYALAAFVLTVVSIAATVLALR